MKERPILFSAPMVRAILAGRKTQTRRTIKDSPVLDVGVNTVPTYVTRRDVRERGRVIGHREVTVECPFGAPGDRLWVKETWSAPPGPYDLMTPREIRRDVPIRYAADGVVRGVSKRFVDEEGRIALGRLRPSIFMRQWMSRITLEVTGVRMGRLQEISAADIAREGVDSAAACSLLPHGHGNGGDLRAVGCGDLFDSKPNTYAWTPYDCWRVAWSCINGADSWVANPWVWCLSFRRVEAKSEAA